jgi:hypothetical protein
MGLIKEPEGIDFVIKSRSLTKKEEMLLSKFIQEEKSKRPKRTAKRVSSKQSTSRAKPR